MLIHLVILRVRGKFGKSWKTIKSSSNIPYRCVMGDFNSVRSCEEKQGLEGTQRGKELEEFNLFIEEMEFMDIPMVGKHFTIFCPNGKAKSRIDRVWCLEIGWIVGKVVLNMSFIEIPWIIAPY